MGTALQIDVSDGYNHGKINIILHFDDMEHFSNIDLSDFRVVDTCIILFVYRMRLQIM